MAEPNKLTVKMYDVGFGDCFLLTFHYDTVDRHLLIDFGSTRASADYMKAVAADIQKQCGHKIDAVVASHRHKDHLSGFKTDNDSANPDSGGIIAGLKPDLVSLTWTEDPVLDAKATGPVEGDGKLSFVSTLRTMQRLADRASVVAKMKPKGSRRSATAVELEDLSEINISNKSALVNLLNMAKPNGQTEYLHYGSKTGLNAMFRGVRFHVLGPPTVDQWSKVKRQVSRNEDEYWHLANYWSLLEGSFGNGGRKTRLFPKRFERSIPSSAKWLVDRMKDPTESDLLRISRVMDRAINNTSIILLIEVWGYKLLFPGDAQIESWDYVLNGPHATRNRKLLSDVKVYKVGHHGSLNGTPKSLWNLFTERKDINDNGELVSLLSSRINIHGKSSRGTEVPRSKLVTALKKGSEFCATPYEIDKRKKLKVSDLGWHTLEVEK